MKPHLVIARKYRPQYLRDLVGQDSVVRILENSMRMGRTAHAYLMVGPRGVGKTSTARIVAMAFNAPEKEGGEYDASKGDFLEIAEGRHPDVLELDAATHSGVDLIRQLLEESSFAPSKLRYRVYLIDEVHMLSQSAFNALLKTLEEPPPRVKFILATTEARKVPVTIKSRCQWLNLRLIPEELIASALNRIALAEGFTLEPAAAIALAEASGGSMRDAQTAMEQVATFTEGKITEKEVSDLRGTVSQQEVFRLADAILSGASTPLFGHLEAIRSQGRDYSALAQSLLQILRRVQREIYAPASAGEPTGLSEKTAPRKLLQILGSLDGLVARMETCLDPSSLFDQWALEACDQAHRSDLLDLADRLAPEDKAALQALLSRLEAE